MKCELISINRAFDHLPTGISIIFSVESRHPKDGVLSFEQYYK